MQNIRLIKLLILCLYLSITGINAQKMVGQELEGFTNSESFDINPSVSPDGNRLIFLRLVGDKDGEWLFYECIRDGNAWSEPKPLNLINLAKGSFSFSSRASFSKTGSTIYFDGSLQGGQGGFDTYSSKLKDGYWQPPVSLGAEINSPEGDLGPWIDENNNLYFHRWIVVDKKEEPQVLVATPDGEGNWNQPMRWFPDLGFFHTEHPVTFRKNAILIYAKNRKKDEHENYLSIKSGNQWSVPILLKFDVKPSRAISATYKFDFIYYDYMGDLYQAKVPENIKVMATSIDSEFEPIAVTRQNEAITEVIPVTQTGSSFYESRIALVIGNADYSQAPLVNPANDANAIAEELEKAGFEVMKYTNINRKEMRDAVRKFGDKINHNEGVGLFYFAGHGIQSDGVNYLVPIGADIQREYDIEDQCLQADHVLRMMERYQNPMNIVILDACRNNPYIRSFRSLERGLAQPSSAPTGSILAFATAPGKTASDGDGQNGLYTQELIKAIRKRGLAIEEVFKEVRINVLELSNSEQSPWENSSLTGDFYFHPDK